MNLSIYFLSINLIQLYILHEKNIYRRERKKVNKILQQISFIFDLKNDSLILSKVSLIDLVLSTMLTINNFINLVNCNTVQYQRRV